MPDFEKYDLYYLNGMNRIERPNLVPYTRETVLYYSMSEGDISETLQSGPLSVSTNERLKPIETSRCRKQRDIEQFLDVNSKLYVCRTKGTHSSLFRLTEYKPL